MFWWYWGIRYSYFNCQNSQVWERCEFGFANVSISTHFTVLKERCENFRYSTKGNWSNGPKLLGRNWQAPHNTFRLNIWNGKTIRMSYRNRNKYLYMIKGLVHYRKCRNVREMCTSHREWDEMRLQIICNAALVEWVVFYLLICAYRPHYAGLWAAVCSVYWGKNALQSLRTHLSQ